MQKLDGHIAADVGVVGLENSRHAATAETLLDQIAADLAGRRRVELGGAGKRRGDTLGAASQADVDLRVSAFRRARQRKRGRVGVRTQIACQRRGIDGPHTFHDAGRLGVCGRRLFSACCTCTHIRIHIRNLTHVGTQPALPGPLLFRRVSKPHHHLEFDAACIAARSRPLPDRRSTPSRLPKRVAVDGRLGAVSDQ